MLAWVGVALAGRWEGTPADVEVTRTVPLSVEAVHEKLSRWSGWAAMLPEQCASEWEIYGDQQGVGAQATALYTIGPMRRRLVGVITQEVPGQSLTTELQGKKGWFTQVTYATVPEGAQVTLRTPLSPPKWPITGLFFRKVKPAWEECYAQALDALGRASQAP